VVTIDPARRLADALGLPGGLSNEPRRITIDAPGELWALMLDTEATFDGLVRANAASPSQAERILSNAFYRNIASSLSGTQEYMAAERLHALHRSGDFDVIVVDTPPTRNALDFLDAPGTLTRFLDHPLFKLLMTPTRTGLKVLSFAAQPVLRTIGKVVGGEVLADAVAFFQAFDGMESGFRTRADDVMQLIRSDATTFVLIASPRGDTMGEAAFFADRLADHELTIGALVVNRATPRFGASARQRPRSAAASARYDNLRELNHVADAEAAFVETLLGTVAAPAVWVPMMNSDVHSLDDLEQIRHALESSGMPDSSEARGRKPRPIR
jgi:anion-transporting  ArsA/GET3 family ATPase